MDSSFWLNALILGWSIKYTVRHKLSISGTYFVDIAVPYRALVWDLLAILPRDWSYTGRNMGALRIDL